MMKFLHLQSEFCDQTILRRQNLPFTGFFRPKTKEPEDEDEIETPKLPFTTKLKFPLEIKKGTKSETKSSKGTKKEKVINVKKTTVKGTKKLRESSGTVKVKDNKTIKGGGGGTLKLFFGSTPKPAKLLPRDDNVVFVAGATGNVGSRVVKLIPFI